MQNTDETQTALAAHGYVADRALATAIFLANKLQRPLFLEGEPGVGKTEIAKVLAAMHSTNLIRLQCHEGLDIASAVYEWDYARQMLEIRLLEATGEHERKKLRQEIFSEEFLIRRPLLQALQDHNGKAPVLLIDELDRSDEEFEAFLLEFLSDWQVSVPEIGTLRASVPPIVVVTSNRTREIHDALKRRCLYHWIDYPDFAKEHKILRQRLPELNKKLSQQIVAFVQALRHEDFYKKPGVAETLDWAASLMALNATSLDVGTIEHSLGALLKYQDDVLKAKLMSQDLLARAQTA